MLLEHQGPWAPVAQAVKQILGHPLCPLTAAEIKRSAQAVRSIFAGQPDIHFKCITLEEPPKALLAPYIDAEHAGRRLPQIDRKAFVSYYIRNTVRFLLHLQGLKITLTESI